MVGAALLACDVWLLLWCRVCGKRPVDAVSFAPGLEFWNFWELNLGRSDLLAWNRVAG